MGSVIVSGSYKVPVVGLDELLTAGVIPNPHVIKMDIEGSESVALEGAQILLAKTRPTVFLAMHGEDQQIQCECLQRAAGYRMYYLDGSEHRPGVMLRDDEIYAVPSTFVPLDKDIGLVR